MPKKWHNEFRDFMYKSRKQWGIKYPEFRAHIDGDKLAGYKLVQDIVNIPTQYLKLEKVSHLSSYMIKKIPADSFVVKALLGNQAKRVICLHRKIHKGEMRYRDILRHRKYAMNLEEITEYIHKSLKRNETSKGSALVIEQFLGDPEVGLPMDYKLYAVKGKVKLISVFVRRLSEKGSSEPDEYTNTFDRDWNGIPLDKIYKYPEDLDYIERAIELEPLPPNRIRGKLIELAEKLARKHGTDFCRYDFYCIRENGEYKIYFGEITPVCGDLNRFELLKTPLEILYP